MSTTEGLQMPRRVFALWLGGTPMSPARRRSLEQLRDSLDVDVELITDAEVHRWVSHDYPLHPAYECLSAVHRADYLRAYLMHVHGGGYSDVKPPGGPWGPVFDEMQEQPRLLAAGYREERWGVSNLGVDPRPRYQPLRLRWWQYRGLQLRHHLLLGPCSFIFRRRSDMTSRWLTAIHRRLDLQLPALRLHPATSPREAADQDRPDWRGWEPTSYPIRWTELCGEILHPLSYRYRYRRRTLRTLPPPVVENYR